MNVLYKPSLLTLILRFDQILAHWIGSDNKKRTLSLTFLKYPGENVAILFLLRKQ